MLFSTVATTMSASMMPSSTPPRQATAESKAARGATTSPSLLSSLSSVWRSKTSGAATAGGAWSANQTTSSSAMTMSDVNPDSAASCSSPSTSSSPPASHLVVLVHGLYGRPSDWDVIVDRLNEHKKRVEDPADPCSPERWRLLPSGVNRRRLTLDGIDTCGRRLAREVRQVVREERIKARATKTSEKEPRLERISFIGHSQGGLIARAAVADLLDDDDGVAGAGPKTSKPATLAGGLVPAHFVSIATPHLGCHADAEATAAFLAATSSTPSSAAAEEDAASAAASEKQHQTRTTSSPRHHPALVPLVGWVASAAASVTGSSVGSVFGGREFASSVAPRLLAAASARAAASLGRSGAQFFLLDGDGGSEGGDKEEGRAPLLARLAEPTSRAHRALAAFESRTCFANSSGDHLVGWANASLRRPEDLPRERLLAATAAAARAAPPAEPAAVATAAAGAAGTTAAGAAEGRSWSLRRRARAANGDDGGGFASSRRGGGGKGGGMGVVLDDGVEAAFDLPRRSPSVAPEGRGERGSGRAARDGDEGDVVDRMLSSLASLPWRRVDACFKGSRSYFLSHNHIQATHFFNAKVGFDSADAIARVLVENDEELLRRRRERERDKGEDGK